MKAVLLTQTKVTSTPILSCGGVVLLASQQLVVRADLVKALCRENPGLKAGDTIEVSSLRNGAYEVRTLTTVATGKAAEAKTEPSPEPLKDRAGDRSMAGVGKGKSKKKG